MLAAVAEGQSFAALCERAAAQLGDAEAAAPAVVAALQRWLVEELLAAPDQRAS